MAIDRRISPYHFLKSMKFISAVLVILVLIGLSGATPDSVQLGKYNVSFDLGQNAGAYAVSAPEEKSSETLDGNPYTTSAVAVLGSQGLIVLQIGVSGNPDKRSANAQYDHMVSDFIEQGFTVLSSNTRKIDGYTGTICEVVNPDDQIHDVASGYVAWWVLDDYTHAIIETTCPWDNGTLALLKTIHLTKAKH